jgi:hypothetical protein
VSVHSKFDNRFEQRSDSPCRGSSEAESVRFNFRAEVIYGRKIYRRYPDGKRGEEFLILLKTKRKIGVSFHAHPSGGLIAIRKEDEWIAVLP